jgi:hypothetical protein
VKVCSLYGAGFYYIPGTDTCLKLGGFVRVEMMGNAGGSHVQFFQPGSSANNDFKDDWRTRTRWMLSLDARTQTEYGTLRSYIRAGTQYTTSDQGATGSYDNKDGVIYVERAFIQLGGFTFGKTASFFDFLQSNPLGYSGGIFGASDTGQGLNLAAYTFTFGNGFTGSISVEDPYYRRIPGVLNTSTTAANGNLPTMAGAGAASRVGYGGVQAPDIVGNLRVDQAWGSAQVMAAAHQVRAQYYGSGAAGAILEGNGRPEDKWGFAVGGAIAVNLPWATGDRWVLQAQYSQGANYYEYIDVANYAAIYNGTSVFEGLNYDAVFGPGGALQLTKVFSLYSGVEHYWTPQWRSSVFGSYVDVGYNDTATASICGTGAYVGGVGGGTCNPDWHMWQVGTRTVWSPVANLELGVELLYSKFETEHDNVFRVNTVSGSGKPAGLYSVEDQDVFSAVARIQRNFWP